MLTLWKDEYARRKRLRIQEPLPNIFDHKSEVARTSIPHDQVQTQKVADLILRNFREIDKEKKIYEDYQVDITNENPLEVEELNENQFSMRYGNIFFKKLKEMREIWAKDGHNINEEDETVYDHLVDTLDIIPSMRSQFREMYK